jgi:hypothetical protein
LAAIKKIGCQFVSGRDGIESGINVNTVEEQDSEAGSQRSEVRGQKPEAGGQRAEVGGGFQISYFRSIIRSFSREGWKDIDYRNFYLALRISGGIMGVI